MLSPIITKLNRPHCRRGKKAYLDYAMSVLFPGALPDVRDGLKPVHRAFFMPPISQSLPHLPFTKSAKLVGEVWENIIPHGDASVYDALSVWLKIFQCAIP